MVDEGQKEQELTKEKESMDLVKGKVIEGLVQNEGQMEVIQRRFRQLGSRNLQNKSWLRNLNQKLSKKK